MQLRNAHSPKTVQQVFISYRSEDTGPTAAALFRDLKARLWPHDVFLDHERIEGGSVWPERLRREVERSAVMLVLIGEHWLTAQDPETGERRLSIPEDWIRQEIELALASKIPIIPVLVDGASPPTSKALRTVPSIARVAKLQAVVLRPKDWSADVKRLIETLRIRDLKQGWQEDGAVTPITDVGSGPLGRDISWSQAIREAGVAQVQNELEALRNKYIPSLYTPRSGIEEQIHSFLASDAQALLILGEAGAGKTNLMCRIAATLSPSRTTFFFRAASLPPNSPDIGHFLDDALEVGCGLRLGASLFSSLRLLLRGNRMLLIIDAINEAPDVASFAEALGTALQRARVAPIQFCLTCRRSDWRFFREDTRITDSLWSPGHIGESNEGHGIRLQRFEESEVEEAWSLYRTHFNIVGDLTGEARKLCKQPLMLRFVCEVFRNRSLPPFLNTLDIFDQYWEAKIHRKPKHSAALFDIVLDLRRHAKTTMHEEALAQLVPPDVYDALLSEEIILYVHVDRHTRVRMVGFMYESFFEYSLARAILATGRWHEMEPDALVAAFNKLQDEAKENRALVGAAEFVVLFFQENRVHEQLLDLFEQSSDWKLRCCALLPRLSNFDSRYDGRLSRLIADDEYWVRWSAAFATAQLQSEEHFDDLISSWLGTPLWQVREGAANALGYKVITPTRWSRIVKAADDQYWRVRRSLANSLNRALASGQLDLAVLKELCTDKSWRRRDVGIIAQRDLAINPSLSHELLGPLAADSNERIRFSIAKFAGTIVSAQHFLPLLARLSKDESSWVRKRVVTSMPPFIAADLVEASGILNQLSNDEDHTVRWEVARVLAHMAKQRDETTEDLLRALESDPVESVRVAAGFSRLRRNGGLPLDFEETFERVKDEDLAIREAVARVQDLIHPPRAVESQRSVYTGWKADHYLGIIRAIQIVSDRLESARFAGLLSLLLEDAEEGVRWALVQIVPSLPVAGAIRDNISIALLRDRQVWVRQASVEALSGRMLDDCPALVRCLQLLATDRDTDVRVALAFATLRLHNHLGHHAPIILETLRNDPDPEVRRAAGR